MTARAMRRSLINMRGSILELGTRPMSNAFESKDVELMLRALDRALTQFRDARRMNSDAESVVRSVLAKAVVDAAQEGERDEEKLSVLALANYDRAKAEFE